MNSSRREQIFTRKKITHLLFLIVTIAFFGCQDETSFKQFKKKQTNLTEIKKPPPVGCSQVNYRSDSFTQNGNQKVDILWVIDNSGSMSGEQADLATYFEVFIYDFIQKDIDFKMAITTTDTSSSKQGKMVGDASRLTATAAKSDEDQFVQDFKNYIRVGTNGSSREAGLVAATKFMDLYSSTFLRDDAFLVVVYVSDENDQSIGSVQSYIETLTNLKESIGKVKTYSIASRYEGSRRGTRYENAATITGGLISDIHDDFSITLGNIGDNIINLTSSFPISGRPFDSQSLEVTINGIRMTSGWSYNDVAKIVTFDQNAVPSDNSSIVIGYIECTEDAL